ncbi:MAG: ABC transporter, substrate-binding protein (cluster 1, maltose/g3p/polyamine/iron), partial [uncultured Acidimicrobiales bacterium]
DRRGLRVESGIEQPGAHRRQPQLHRQLDLGVAHGPGGEPGVADEHPADTFVATFLGSPPM